jgi:hypothetical protein
MTSSRVIAPAASLRALAHARIGLYLPRIAPLLRGVRAAPGDVCACLCRSGVDGQAIGAHVRLSRILPLGSLEALTDCGQARVCALEQPLRLRAQPLRLEHFLTSSLALRVGTLARVARRLHDLALDQLDLFVRVDAAESARSSPGEELRVAVTSATAYGASAN